MLLRLSDPTLLDDLVAACQRAGLEARGQGSSSILTRPTYPRHPKEPDDQERMEMLLFVRTWSLEHPGVRVDVDDE